jgi:hypothetical protein
MKLTPQRVRKALLKSGAVLTETAALLQISRSALYAFLNKHPELQELRSRIEDEMLNRAQSRLAEAVLAGEVEACIRYVSMKGKGRGVAV